MGNRSVQSDQKSSPNKSMIAEDVSETEHPPTQMNGADSNGILLDNGGEANTRPSLDNFDSDDEHLDKNEGPDLPFNWSKRYREDADTSDEEPPLKRRRDESRTCTYRQKNFIHAKGNTICIEIGYVSAGR